MLLSVSTLALSQQALDAGGGEASGQAGTLSFSIGQVDYASYVAPAGSTNLGVQQSFEPFKPAKNIKVACLIYPNPASEAINLSAPDPTFLSFSYVLYDSLGKIHRRSTGLNVSDSVQLDGLANGIYFISIKNNLEQVWNCHLVKVSP